MNLKLNILTQGQVLFSVAKEIRVMENKLSGDGIRLALYRHLWTKSTHHSMNKSFRMPDTIIYKFKLPTMWVFTSSKDGLLKIKSDINITKQNILKKFFE